MYAIIETGGKQYKVQIGDEINIEKLNIAEGEAVNSLLRLALVLEYALNLIKHFP